MGIFEKIQAKLELFRLEQRYTRHRNRRSTFVSNAVYVDGEYVYQTPNSTGSSQDSSSSNHIDALHGEKNVTGAHVPPMYPALQDPPSEGQTTTTITAAERKRLHRFSSMAGFGRNTPSKEMPTVQERRMSMIR
ncbi:hypothetical protein S40288_02141 [Stachybotrys chartarum IBT 40288]|nr:hypothetical protein S40288_02141 [Stachybotrys chartarum IBT 40288]